MKQFTPPKDLRQWWMAPHCGPGTLDANDICGFCGDSYRRCAERNSESSASGHEQSCGGAGLWCKGCGRFWAQDSCGESPLCRSADGGTLKEAGGFAYCVCGKRLFALEEDQA